MDEHKWDGQRWWTWSGAAWSLDDPQPPAPPEGAAVAVEAAAVPAKRRKTARVVAVVAVVAVLAVVGAGVALMRSGSVDPPAAQHKVEGTFTNSTAFGTYGGTVISDGEHISELMAGKTFDCADGGERQPHYRAGDTVVFADQSGTVIGTGHLEGGKQDLGGCHFTFNVTVPDATNYQVTVAGSDPYIISKSELESQGWVLTLKV